MRAAAERVRAAYSDVRAGGTHQARLERDIAWDVTQRRLADLDIGDVAARVRPPRHGRRASRWYVGRLAVEDETHTPLVVDWRAPVAEPFYRATAVEPMAVVRRRHLITRKGREVTGLDDEVFDQRGDRRRRPRRSRAKARCSPRSNATAPAAWATSSRRSRPNRTRRSAPTSPASLVVAGGPGTGKTAVALHRAAYLLYTHRRRLGAQGVLLVGPSPVFLRYIEHVLPSLGEQDVQLSTIAGLQARACASRAHRARRDVAR